MPTRQHFNRILVLWLLIALGFAVSPARSVASCDMGQGQMVASGHACCVHKQVCACEPSAQPLEQRTSAVPIVCGSDCPCVAPPQPASPAPSIEPMRLYMVAALPVRAGPVFISEIVADCITASLPPEAFPRFVPPSPPRAPPF